MRFKAVMVLVLPALMAGIAATAHAGATVFDFEKVIGHDGIQKVENAEAVDNQQGTTDVTALVTYSDGRQETCSFPVGHKVGFGGEWLSLKSENRTCSNTR